ncbi:hypothetical protein HGRIS_009865 [Hohenbuehelia grisea]|uniref:Uncharacterized protein n=1 Tax=Hohenbuehelia grisea TaxID=104357 RepID=A0ABR3J2Y3_9AGAR
MSDATSHSFHRGSTTNYIPTEPVFHSPSHSNSPCPSPSSPTPNRPLPPIPSHPKRDVHKLIVQNPSSPEAINSPHALPAYHAPATGPTVLYFDPSSLYSDPSSGATDDPFLSPSSSSPAIQSPNAYQTHFHEPPPAREHPFSKSFEPPDWRLLVLHVAACVLAYPILLIFVLIAKEKSLFWTRFIVSCGCGAVGFCLGLSLLNLGKSFLEAATWATLIHQSRVTDAPGIRMRDFAAASQDSASAWNAVRLLWNRMTYSGTARRQRRTYDRRRWSLYIVFFLAVIVVSASLPFFLGRLVDINASMMHQSTSYHEVLVKGDLSSGDIAKAQVLQNAFNDFRLTWTLSPFSAHGGLPPPVAFTWSNDTVFFSETTKSQLCEDGSGLGTFETSTTAPVNTTSSIDEVSSQGLAKDMEPGTLVRYPRWGIRIHCRKIPNADTNIIPRSFANFTYMFTPRDTVRALFSSFDMDMPKILEQPLNASLATAPGDRFPSGIDPQSTALAAAFYDNGVAHSFKSTPLSMGEEGTGFVSLEGVLVRLNTSYTPDGKFPKYSDASIPDATGKQTRIGYDGAMCLQLYEPWIVEVMNSTSGAPTSRRIVRKANEVEDLTFEEKNTGRRLQNVKTKLNSSGLSAVYDVIHGNSINQMLKDNGRDASYVPSPTVVSFTGGEGPEGYIELSETFFAEARARADASNVLPYFAGTGSILARSYPDRIMSSSHMNTPMTIGLLAIALALGLIAALFVPRLPLGVPRRGFELYSWVAALQGDDVAAEMNRAGVRKNMELRDVEKRLGDLRFRYVV